MPASGAEFSDKVNMAEVADLSEDDDVPEGEALYERNLAGLSTLEEYERQDKGYRKCENFWRRAGPTIAMTPLAVSTAILLSPLANHMERYAKVEAEFFGGFGSFVVGAILLYAHDKTREKAQKKAESAAPISRRINNRTLPWIDRRLAEKEADELRARKNRGLA